MLHLEGQQCASGGGNSTATVPQYCCDRSTKNLRHYQIHRGYTQLTMVAATAAAGKLKRCRCEPAKCLGCLLLVVNEWTTAQHIAHDDVDGGGGLCKCGIPTLTSTCVILTKFVTYFDIDGSYNSTAQIAHFYILFILYYKIYTRARRNLTGPSRWVKSFLRVSPSKICEKLISIGVGQNIWLQPML